MVTPVVREITRGRGHGCAVCATHRRPQDVPWNQHALGCVLRAASLAADIRRPRIAA
jgi:hypothetical protein